MRGEYFLIGVLGLIIVPLTAELPSRGFQIEGGNDRIVELPSGSGDASELSAITYVGQNRYYVASDGTAKLYPIEIELHPSTGRIRRAALGQGVPLQQAQDIEGLAYRSRDDAVFAVDEAGPALRQYDPADGRVVSELPIPSRFQAYRANFSLESLTYRAGADELWVANEDALEDDGPVSSVEQGGWIRLQRLDGSGEPAGQFAYRADPISARSPFTELERSGVVDLVALPDGRLLVLERALGGFLPRFRHRIYLADPSGATDISDSESLAGLDFEPVSKERLWEGVAEPAFNFEGMTMGPSLGRGRQALLLIADNGGAQGVSLKQALWPLVLSHPGDRGGPPSRQP